MKKNVLAVALVAGLGLAGGAAAYNYGTATFGPASTTVDTSESPQSPAGILDPEQVAYQVLFPTTYDYTMSEDLVFDIQLPDNAVQVTTGFTVRVRLNRNNCVASGAPYPASDTNCSTTLDGALFNTANIPTAGTGAGQLELNANLVAAGWQVQFDGYYDGGQTASIRIIPAAGNNANPGPGEMLRWHNAQLTSLDEFAVGDTTKVDAEFWMVNASNDSRFTGSTKSRTILERTTAITACADADDAETDKYIDVADSWNAETMPKSRFSFDGKLGSAQDTGYDSQWINMGDVTITNSGAGGFTFLPDDRFVTVLTAGAGDNWMAFDNDHLDPNDWYNDDIWLSTGTCTSGSMVQGEVNGNTVTFNYEADDVALPAGAGTTRLTVCGFVDSDIVIDDHNTSVATTFTRQGGVHPTPTFEGASCNLLPLRYNGSTMEIFTINPGSNTTQRSFLRLTNRSATDGFVSLEGIRDDGVRGDSQVRIWVPAGQSVQVNASELESGTFDGLTASGAWSAAPDGVKWRAVVTAEFPGLVASSLVNSALPRVLTNITDSDTRGEQIGRDFNEGTWGVTPGERPSDFAQEFEPDFRGNGESTEEPGGPNLDDGPAGGTTEPCGNPGNGNGNATDDHDESNEDPYCYQAP